MLRKRCVLGARPLRKGHPFLKKYIWPFPSRTLRAVFGAGLAYDVANYVSLTLLFILIFSWCLFQTNGPVEVGFNVYDDFPLYKSGVYVQTSQNSLGGHAVKMIGVLLSNT